MKEDIMTTAQIIGLAALVFISFAPGLFAYFGTRKLKRETLILLNED